MLKVTLMKRNARLAAALVAGCLTAFTSSAQWSADFQQNIPISNPDQSGASLVKVNEAPNGRIWVTWLQWEAGMNGHIKTQLMEKDGTPVFEEGGIYVMNQPTATWTSNFDAKCDPDGNLIVCHSDARSEGDVESYQAFDPYVYKMDQEGNQLWGLEGVALPTSDSAGHRPKIGISNDGTIIVGYNDVVNSNNSMQFVLMKINNDGTLAWDAPIPVYGGFGVLAPCGESDFYLSILQNGKIMLYCLDSLGDFVWEHGVVVEDRDPNTRSEIVPVSDELGGVFMPYQRYVNMSTFFAGVQRVNEDGDPCLGMQGIDLGNTDYGQSGAPGLGVNGKRQEFVAYWDHDYGGDSHLTVQKYDYTGEPLWAEPKVLDTQYMWGYATSGGKVLDDGSSILIYGQYNGSVKLEMKVTRLDPDGNLVWTKTISPEAYMSHPDAVFDGNQAYIFWADNRVKKGSSPDGVIWGQNINLESGVGGEEAGIENVAEENNARVAYSNGVLTYTGEAGEVAIYDATGAKVYGNVAAEGQNNYNVNLGNGLYIISTPAGTTKILK